MLVIADASFLYAAVDTNDLNHKKASDFFRDETSLTLVIPFSTVLQTGRLIRSVISQKTEMLFLDKIIKNFNIEMHVHDDIVRAFQILEYCNIINNPEIELDEALFISICERLKSNNILTFRKKIYEKIMPLKFKNFNFLI